MTNNRIRVAFAPLYLQLYDEALPGLRDQLMPMVSKVRGMLELFADVHELAMITTHEDAEKLRCAGAEADAVVLLHMAYSPSLLVADVLKNIGKPLLLLDTTFNRGFDEMDETYLLKNHGIHGVMDLAAVLRSKGVRYRVCAGYHGDADFADALADEMAILQASVRYTGQNIGFTGAPFEMMGDFAVGTEFLEKRFGHHIVPVTEKEIADEMECVDDTSTEALFAEDVQKCRFSGDTESLKRSIREYLALKTLFGRQGISAYTMSFNEFNVIPAPFYAINRLLADGIGYAGEGDLITASLGLPLNLLSRRAAFTEFFCPDWHNNLLLMSHMGEADPRFAKQGAPIRLVEKAALGKRLKSYYYHFEAQPMEMTFATWRQEPGGGVSLLAGALDCVDHPIYDVMGVPQFVVRPKLSLREFLTAYSMQGGGHHLYVAEGNMLDKLAAFCGFIAVRLDVI